MKGTIEVILKLEEAGIGRTVKAILLYNQSSFLIYIPYAHGYEMEPEHFVEFKVKI